MRHPLANPKWTLPEGAASARLTREATARRVEENLEGLGDVAWADVASARTLELFDARDGADVAAGVFGAFVQQEGRRYYAGCEVALREAPDRYLLRSELELAVPASEFAEGVLGDGDNVFSHADVSGTVLVVRAVSEVHRLMLEGVPDDTIGLIDDAGGTMTAPILPDFAGVVCLAGTVRSHLAIIAREFGVPTLMGARLTRPLRTGEEITVAYSAPAQSVEAYFGEDLEARAEIPAPPVSEWAITEEQLGRVNRFLQSSGNQMLHNCLTRTAQESKLFPIMPYLQLNFFEAYYRFPDILRRASAVISPEDCGHRARNATCNLGRLTSWGIANFYLNARTELIKLGLVRPEDNLEDLWTVVDWYERFAATYHRRNAHMWTLEAWDISQDHEERVLQVFEADAHEADAKLRHAATRFIAVATQYAFLVHCESRVGLQSAGPYRLDGRRLLHTRDFLNLSECDFSWLDGIGATVPHNNLTAVVITDGVAVEINDFATAYTTPEHYQDRIIGFGLYTSDFLTDRHLPVGMDSRADLVATLDALTQAMKDATGALYRRFAEMSFDQMVEAGIYTYFQCLADVAHMAGEYRQEEWEMVDERTRRLWELYSEEYALDSYMSNFATADGHQGAENEYYLNPVSYRLWRRAGGESDLPDAGRPRPLVPGHVLDDDDYPRRANPNGAADVRGGSSLPAKTGPYTFTSGRLTQEEMNAAARAYDSPLLRAPWRNLDDPGVKYRWREPEVDALYRYTQERSRLLCDRGSSLLRADLDRIRAEAGERPWSAVSAGAGAAVGRT